MAASAQGLDVSNFQGAFNWAGARAANPQLAFGICKLTEGLSFTDSQATHNWQQLHANGLVRGGYHFGHPGESASAQVDFFLAEAAKLGLLQSDLLVLDLEVTDGLTPAQVSLWGQAFMSALVKARPHNPRLLYTYIDFAKQGNCDGLGRYPLWLAYPNSAAPQPPMPWTKWQFWQWGTRNGTDADAFNGTGAALADWLSTFTPAPSPPLINSGPHTATGKQSLRGFAHHNGLAVQEVWWETTVWMAKGNTGYGPAQRDYLAAGNWDALMPEGMIVVLP